MSEEADESPEVGIVAGVLSLLAGLLVPLFFNALTQAQEIGISLIVFSCFAAVIVYGRLDLRQRAGLFSASECSDLFCSSELVARRAGGISCRNQPGEELAIGIKRYRSGRHGT